MAAPKFIARIISARQGKTPTGKNQEIAVSIDGERLILTMWAQRNELDQDSFRLDVDRRGYVTPALDITDIGDGEWVVNVYDGTGAKYQVRKPEMDEAKDLPGLRCREGCEQGIFRNLDQTIRCRGCHLYVDQCTCPPEAKLRTTTMMGIVKPY